MAPELIIVDALVLAAIPSVLYLSLAKKKNPVTLSIVAAIPLVLALYVATDVCVHYGEYVGMGTWIRLWRKDIVGLLLGLAAIGTVPYLCVTKRRSPLAVGLILAGTHLVFVLWTASVEGSRGLLWMRLYYLDMPISLGLWPVARLFELSGWVPDLFIPAYLGVLGSAQYFLWGLLLARLLAGRRFKEYFHSRTEAAAETPNSTGDA